MSWTKERVIEFIKKARLRTVDRGATPAEAAGFAAKVAELLERFQIEEAEIAAATGAPADSEEVCQNKLRTGKRVFNPGMTQVVNSLAIGMCCKVVLLHEGGMAVYGVIGSQMDADYVCQMSTALVPQLQEMATMEGREHGHEKAGLVRWSNQYLTGAGQEIRARLERERQARSEAKAIEHRLAAELPRPDGGPRQALALITGASLAVAKRERSEAALKELYPSTRTTRSRSEYDGTAHEQGRRAGRRIGLHVGIEGGE